MKLELRSVVAEMAHTALSAMAKRMGVKSAFQAIQQRVLRFDHRGWSMGLANQPRLRHAVDVAVHDASARIMRLIGASESSGRLAVQCARENKR